MEICYSLIIPMALAAIISSSLIPCWIKVCHKWGLFEKADDDRKRHKNVVPTMGGLAIFAGTLFSFLVFSDSSTVAESRYLLAACIALFFTGFFDDLLDLPALRKLLLQILCAIIVAYDGARITNLYGVFGVTELPIIMQYLLTICVMVLVTNAYNLIDGIDGLAGSLGMVSTIIFGFLFLEFGRPEFAVLSFALAGALLGFLFYNFHPAKIFMGDSGSLLIGFILSTQAIQLLNCNASMLHNGINFSPALIAAVLFIPIYDVIRVSVIRILTGHSPLRADRNHIHHMINQNGFGQRVTTVLIVVMNLMFVGLALMLPKITLSLFMVLCLCLGMITINSYVISGLANIYGRLGGKVYRRVVQAN